MTATQPETFTIDRLETPMGPILIAVDEAGRLCALDFFGDEAAMRRLLRRQYGDVAARFGQAPPTVRQAFARYFGGEIHAFADVETRTGGTAFQRQVWRALKTIPPGQTRSYGQIAAQIGAPAAVRAVGLANGANPVGVAIPCHRVIGANGALTGFGGGLDRKRWLLRHEGAAFRDGTASSGRLQPELEFGQASI